jgi:hypothetical protein
MFAKRNPLKPSRWVNHQPREDAYEPLPIASSTHRIKQIVLWMDVIHSARSSLALRGKIKVDRWRINV